MNKITIPKLPAIEGSRSSRADLHQYERLAFTRVFAVD